MRMKLIAGASILALHCSVSDDAPAAGAATPESALEKFGDEVKQDLSNVGKAISTEAAVLIAKAESGYDWVKSELAKLEPTVAADLDAAVEEVIQDFISGKSEAVTVADLLTVLYRDGADIVAKVDSDLLAAYVALVKP